MGPSVRRSPFLLSLAAALLGLASAGAAAALEVGAPAPPLVVPIEAEDRFSVAEEWREGPVLVAFVSPYCEACQETLEAIREVEVADVAQVVYVVLGPRRGGFEADAAPAAVIDGGDGEAKAYGVTQTPTFFLVGRGGTLLWKHQGALSAATLRGALDDALDMRLLAAQVLHR